MRRLAKTTVRGYGWRYQQARAQLLASHPPCHWCGVEPATTADHDPPLEETGRPHLNLVPACQRCNLGRRGRRILRATPSRVW